MKRLFATTFMLFALLAASNVQAAMVWNWNFDDMAGTLTTLEAGYAAGTYTIDDFIVTDAGSTGFETGVYPLSSGPNPHEFTWDGMQIASIFSSNGLVRWDRPIGKGSIGCISGTLSCQAYDGLNQITVAEGLLSVTPQAVPIPAAAWLFMSGIIGLVWKGRKARLSVA